MLYINILLKKDLNGKNLIGGLIVCINGEFKFFQKALYKTYKESPNDWEKFDSLLK